MNHLLLRSAKDADLNAIHALAKESGFGLTTLPKNRTLLAQRLEHATASWQHIRHTPNNEYYLFVLEDPKTNQIIGTSAIEARTGAESPFYSYKLSKRIKTLYGRSSKNQHEDELLNLVNDHQGHTELCTLYLTPAYRKEQCGAFLSRARFLLMSQYPERFAKTVIAEMRGVTTPDGSSPFWDAVGYHFFHLSFIEADRLTLSTDKQFIADFMPEYPIYVKLLSAEAQAVIGKPHASTVPAMQLLMNEGFYYNHYVDIFDAGPVLETPLSQIKTYQNTAVFILKKTTQSLKSAPYLISNTSTDFRATKAFAELNRNTNTCILSTKTAALLQLKPGDPVRIAAF
ncbi:MAG: arginine N-succinyltransferase [Legionella sp.]|nr:arginine N-succinyltransferase [Legionella sp.]